MNDPCWEGYEMIGMKKKGGRTVPNCVPKKSPSNRMPYEIVRTGQGKGFVKNTKTGKEYSSSPIPIERAVKQERLLRAVEHGFKPTGKKEKE